jgi:hypothetical protein
MLHEYLHLEYHEGRARELHQRSQIDRQIYARRMTKRAVKQEQFRQNLRTFFLAIRSSFYAAHKAQREAWKESMASIHDRRSVSSISPRV